jgi:MazG family protein
MTPAPPPTPPPAALPDPPLAQTGARLTALVEVMNRLLAEDGCPWDREQTLATLRPYLIEEAYEALEAIDSGDVAGHRDELGDVLFQIVFQAALRAREGAFGIDDVCAAVEHKMKSRHPHVFADTVVKDSAEVLKNWTALKAAEHERAGKKRKTLDGVPASLPALLRAQRLGEKAATVGFDWPDISGVRAKLAEELAEFDAALAAAPHTPRDAAAQAAIEAELGDVLFTLTRLASKLGFSPEDALRGAIARFSARFNAMEERVSSLAAGPAASGEAAASEIVEGEMREPRTLKDLTLDEMNAHWEAVKRILP